MSKFVAGIIGWCLSIIWTAVVFVAGIVLGCSIMDRSENRRNGKVNLHEV